MRLKNASINVIVNFMTFFLGLLPSFIVRKVFLDSLGNTLLGLNSLYTNLIGVLSIADLGIGTAIIYSLYKPFAEEDPVKVKGYLNYYSKFYRIVGIIIFISGLLFTPFLHFFIKDEINLSDARFYFTLFLLNTLISYLFSYKLCLLNVAQEGYKVSLTTTLSKLLISILQFLFLKFYPNFYLYILIQIIINLFYYLFLNIYIDKKFNWIKGVTGFITYNERKSLVKNIKAIFMHQIGGLFVFGIDNLVISTFLNLKIVGIFNSYQMVVGAFQGIISNSILGVTASIGNLLAEGHTQNAYKVHKRLFFISFWGVSFITISLYNTIKQFVILWLGKDQIIDQLTLCIVLINFYFMLMRGSVERFKEGGGIYYQDRFAPIFESIINLIASIALVKVIGLPGVFLGTLISNFTVVFWVKPKMVYKYVFNIRLREYFKMYFTFLLIGIIPLVTTRLATLRLEQNSSILAFIANCIINIVLINSIYFIVFRRNEEFLYFKELGLKSLKKLGFRFMSKLRIQKGV